MEALGKVNINDDIIAIKDNIFYTVGETCEKIILLSSCAYGTPREVSDYDFFIILKDNTEKPILVLKKIYRSLAKRPMMPSIDVLQIINLF